MQDFPESNCILNANQVGFRKDRPTVVALIEYVNSMLDSFDKMYYVWFLIALLFNMLIEKFGCFIFDDNFD